MAESDSPLLLRLPMSSRVIGVLPGALGLAFVVKLVLYHDDWFLIPVTVATAGFLQWFYGPIGSTLVRETDDALEIRAGLRSWRFPWSEIESIRCFSATPKAGVQPVPHAVSVLLSGDRMVLLPEVYGNGWTKPKEREVKEIRERVVEAWRRHQPIEGDPR